MVLEVNKDRRYCSDCIDAQSDQGLHYLPFQ